MHLCAEVFVGRNFHKFFWTFAKFTKFIENFKSSNLLISNLQIIGECLNFQPIKNKADVFFEGLSWANLSHHTKARYMLLCTPQQNCHGDLGVRPYTDMALLHNPPPWVWFTIQSKDQSRSQLQIIGRGFYQVVVLYCHKLINELYSSQITEMIKRHSKVQGDPKLAPPLGRRSRVA